MQIATGHPAAKQVLGLLRGHGQPGSTDALEEAELTVAEGFWACEAVRDAARDRGLRVVSVLYCPQVLRPDGLEVAHQLADLAEQAYEISAKTLQRLAERDRPDGLIAVVELPTWTPGSLALAERALVLVADGIEQPGNLGTLIRTLDACGADALVLTNPRTRRANVKVFRASHGTVLRVPCLSFATVADGQDWLDGAGFGVYLADTEGASRYSDLAYADRTALVLGNERFGIDRAWYRESAARVFIPMLGVADSLNVSISAAVLLYEARSKLADWR
ncbi:hypothetical protein M6D93_18275 [Jatrophihabitans telluris]|uniref:tRNA/rRNA methyltransferase SpoU type domain-containing protein n=1 Tax=Jatrophihabitans telluris TaxID=2038343 RepID=A0ABY4QYL2_9ACTN|nr:TrmH family RNA methyltransferase [Jatrophihabitans telluris]UQX88212.1 hypothetical protein M6D93_18275 [Jatrophihabitans telluris]